MKKKKKIRRKKVKLLPKPVVIGMSLMFAMIVILIIRYNHISNLRYEINDMKKDLENRVSQRKELSLKLEYLNKSDIIEKTAREKLGMDYPQESQIIYIRVD